VEDIITALSRFKALFVIARNSSFVYKGRAVDVKQIGRELGVRYVLERQRSQSGKRVRITGQLVDTSTGAHLWADRFDGGLSDVFDLQDQVTTRALSGRSRQRWKSRDRACQAQADREASTPPMPSIYAVWPGFISLVNRQATTRALRLFNSAIELDPDFASAYVVAAFCTSLPRSMADSDTANAMPK